MKFITNWPVAGQIDLPENFVYDKPQKSEQFSSLEMMVIGLCGIYSLDEDIKHEDAITTEHIF